MKKVFLCAFIALSLLWTACERQDPSCEGFSVQFEENNVTVVVGETSEIEFVANNVKSLVVSEIENGWTARIEQSTLYITAPSSVNDGNKTCKIILKATCVCGDTRNYTVDCEARSIAVLTFEDNDTHFTPYIIDGCNVTINTWSDLIDEVQYGGKLLYNDFNYTGYKWHDEGNTELASGVIDGGVYWNGGHAISDYYSADYSLSDYEKQLQVSTGRSGAAGHNGSKNFAVHNGYVDDKSYNTTLPQLYFADGVARVVRSMYVVNTSYTLNSLRIGNDFSPAATATTWYKITATGYDENGVVTGTTDFMLCDGKDKIVDEWTEWPLYMLGAVVKIEFNISASDDLNGQFGLTAPAYFAYDDVTVLM